MDAFTSGTLAGAGSFRCESCGFPVALHERDTIPRCPHCHGQEFKRASIFGDQSVVEPCGNHEVDTPEWLAEARDALIADGQYLAYENEDRVHVLPLQDGWTRLGRSLAAHVRLDDPTVSRRHALVHLEDDGARILDDRSLNGVFLNGERVDWRPLADGDEVTIGRFRIYFVSVSGSRARLPEEVGSTAA